VQAPQARVKESREGYWTKVAELSRMLLGPVASQLGKKRLVIVADGALQYIPLARGWGWRAGLCTPARCASSQANGRWTIGPPVN
jgi:hypothetical protein